MVEEVNKIIYNMLISGRGVYLPEVGTLFIERQGAKRLDKKRLLSPRNVVTFSSQAEAPSLVDEIVAIAGCELAQAQDIYERWIAKTRTQNDVLIGGVGVLRGKSFVADKAFAAAINPKGVKTLVVRQKQSHAWIYAVCAVAVIVALAFFVYLQWGDSWGLNKSVISEPTTVEQVASESAEAVDSVAQAEPVAQPAQSGPYSYYVVMGVFSTEQNAERATEQLQSKIPTAKCETLLYYNKYMVTAFGSNSRAECNLFVSSYNDVYPDLWVYNKK